jgi:hypothetical protein
MPTGMSPATKNTISTALSATKDTTHDTMLLIISSAEEIPSLVIVAPFPAVSVAACIITDIITTTSVFYS